MASHSDAANALLNELDAIRRIRENHLGKKRRLGADDEPRSAFLSVDHVVDRNSALFGSEGTMQIVRPMARRPMLPEVEQALYAAFRDIFGAERDKEVSFPADSQALYRS
jgi:hypothetical protein